MDDYIVDVYLIINPYENKYRHLERARFTDIRLCADHMEAVKKKYNVESKEADYVITTCKGDYSADNAIKHVIQHLAHIPKKSEIN